MFDSKLVLRPVEALFAFQPVSKRAALRQFAWIALASGICAALSGCCDEYPVATAKSRDGATARVLSRDCGATTAFVTKIYVGSNEAFRANEDARAVTVAWAEDGRTLVVSLPEELSRRNIFVKRNAVGGRMIKYVWRPPDVDAKPLDRSR